MHVCLAASMSADAHLRCKSPHHSVLSPCAMFCSMANSPGDLIDAVFVVCAVRGRHPHGLHDATKPRVFCHPLFQREPDTRTTM